MPLDSFKRHFFMKLQDNSLVVKENSYSITLSKVYTIYLDIFIKSKVIPAFLELPNVLLFYHQ